VVGWIPCLPRPMFQGWTFWIHMSGMGQQGPGTAPVLGTRFVRRFGFGRPGGTRGDAAVSGELRYSRGVA